MKAFEEFCRSRNELFAAFVVMAFGFGFLWGSYSQWCNDRQSCKSIHSVDFVTDIEKHTPHKRVCEGGEPPVNRFTEKGG